MSLLQSREHHNTVTVLIRCSRELPSCFVVLAICVCAAKENVSDHLHALHFCLSLTRLLLLLLLPSSCSTPLDRSACCGPFVLRLLELSSRVSRLRLLRCFSFVASTSPPDSRHRAPPRGHTVICSRSLAFS